jgi:hypothetical protein
MYKLKENGTLDRHGIRIENNYIKYQLKQKKILKFNLSQRRLSKLDLLKRFKSTRYNGRT